MTPEEYAQRKAEIEIKYKKEMKELNKKYALSNSTYQIGDTITDGNHTLIINDIRADYRRFFPSCRYYGVELRKDGKPKKRQDGYCIFQSCVKGKL